MAYTSPRTWVAGETVTAALLNTHVRDNLLEVNGTASAWTAYTPTLTGFVGTITEARYKQVGKTVNVSISLTATGAVTATIFATTPVVARTSSVDRCVGTAAANDAGVAYHVGSARLEAVASPRVFVATHGAGTQWSAASPFTWGATDVLHIAATYEAA